MRNLLSPALVLVLTGSLASPAVSAQPGYGWGVPAAPPPWGGAAPWTAVPARPLPPWQGGYPGRGMGPAASWAESGSGAGVRSVVCCSPGLEYVEIYPGTYACVPSPNC